MVSLYSGIVNIGTMVEYHPSAERHTILIYTRPAWLRELGSTATAGREFNIFPSPTLNFFYTSSFTHIKMNVT